MIKRKLFTVLLATPTFLLIIFSVFFNEWQRPLELLVMTGWFSLIVSPFVLLYGLPVSFLSDFLTRKFGGVKRQIISFLIHVCFGALFGLLAPSNTHFLWLGIELDWFIVYGAVGAFIFWVVDELLRRKIAY